MAIMPLIPMTSHARKRAQQRGISPAAINLALQFGSTTYVGGGCTSHRVDRRSLRKIRNFHGRAVGQLEDKIKNLEVVTDDSSVVTVLHRVKRRHQ